MGTNGTLSAAAIPLSFPTKTHEALRFRLALQGIECPLSLSNVSPDRYPKSKHCYAEVRFGFRCNYDLDLPFSPNENPHSAKTKHQ